MRGVVRLQLTVRLAQSNLNNIDGEVVIHRNKNSQERRSQGETVTFRAQVIIWAKLFWY